jgi:hypothetical protein
MILLYKTSRRVKNLVIRTLFRIHDLYFGTYAKLSKGDLSLERIIKDNIHFTPTEEDRTAVSFFLEHRFNLLGSGWINVYNGMQCDGLEGKYFESNESIGDLPRHSNKKYTDELKSRISASYIPIDWHIDFRTGYRWCKNIWYRDIQYGQTNMGDVKVPWELSRLQHLPDIAIQYSSTKDIKYVQEFKDQVLDWVSSNPPRWGVNWACTMDVSIRIVNLLISYDIFRAADVVFDDFFNEVIFNSAYDHAFHISTNLEWSENHTGNHYLSNVCGLFIVSMYLHSNERIDSWLTFAIQELLVETPKQFLSDGGHYEFSSSYHRLCAEMIAVCLIFAEGIDKKRLEKLVASKTTNNFMRPKIKMKYLNKISENYIRTNTLFGHDFVEFVARAANLTLELTKPNGNIVQIGDNDSGRFLRLGGWLKKTQSDFSRNDNVLHMLENYEKDSYLIYQNNLNHFDWLISAHLITNDFRLVNNIKDYKNSSIFKLGSSFIKRGSILNYCYNDLNKDVHKVFSVNNKSSIDSNRTVCRSHILSSSMEFNTNLLDGIELRSFPDFGIFLYRSKSMFLAVRCVNILDNSLKAHLHSDQLSFELMVEGSEIAVDPGTYVYTASKRARNTYRSAFVHVGPSVIDIRNPEKDLELNVFDKLPRVDVQSIKADEDYFIGKISGSWGSVERTYKITEKKIEITDRYSLRPNYKPASLDLFKPVQKVIFSSGYGELLAYE